MDKLGFVTKAMKAAQDACREGTLFPPGIVAAQAAFESDYGKSELCVEANNPLKILAGLDWAGERFRVLQRGFDPIGVWAFKGIFYRKYKDLLSCFRDFGRLLEARRPISSQPHAFLNQTNPNPGFEEEKKKILAIARRWRLI